MRAQRLQAGLFWLASSACTSTATVGWLGEPDLDMQDASSRDASQTDVSDARVLDALADVGMASSDASSEVRSEASVLEAAVGCADDRGCPAGRMCSRGACVQCVVDAHCAGQEETRCDARGRCVECRSTAECSSNQVCAPWGECELTCTRDAQCLAALRCDANFRVCLECVEDTDCSGLGEFCDEGVCARCAGNPDCPN